MSSGTAHLPARPQRRSAVAAAQRPLRRAYEADPTKALIVDRGSTGGPLGDAVHTHVVPGEEYDDAEVGIAVGTHRGVGGLHDAPNPGELLCAALAACQDSAVRMVADLLGVRLESLKVEVEGDVDLRGTLAVEHSVRVGFQSMRCRTEVEVAPGTDSRTAAMMVAAAERSCVVLDTLRAGVEVHSEFDLAAADQSRRAEIGGGS